MALTRKERIKLEHDRRKIAGLEMEKFKVEVPDEVRCDECGEPRGTLYEFDGRLICSDDVPFEYKYGRKHYKLIRLAVSGAGAILAARRKLAKH